MKGRRAEDVPGPRRLYIERCMECEFHEHTPVNALVPTTAKSPCWEANIKERLVVCRALC